MSAEANFEKSQSYFPVILERSRIDTRTSETSASVYWKHSLTPSLWVVFGRNDLDVVESIVSRPRNFLDAIRQCLQRPEIRPVSLSDRRQSELRMLTENETLSYDSL